MKNYLKIFQIFNSNFTICDNFCTFMGGEGVKGLNTPLVTEMLEKNLEISDFE